MVPTRFGPEVVEPAPAPRWPVVASVAAFVLLVAVGVGAWVGEDAPGEAEEVPLLVGPGVQDDFTRSEDRASSLGQARSGQEWDEVAGRWAVADGVAVLEEVNDLGERSLALVDLGSGDGAVSITAAEVANGLGLVFRFEDAFNYWLLTASPDFGGWRLSRIEEGQVVDVAALPLTPTAPGTTAEVRFSGRDITVFLDGTEVRSLTDPALADATRVGLLFQGGDPSGAAWDDFVAVPEGGTPSTTVAPS